MRNAEKISSSGMWRRVDLVWTNVSDERSSETSVHTRSTRRHIPKDDILHGYRRENIKSYTVKNAVHSWVHALKHTWHLGRQMSHFSVQTRLEGFFKLVLLRSQTCTTSGLSIDEKYIVFLRFLNKGCTVTFCYLISSTCLISLNFKFISAANCYCL
jgi:hypothetical protein